MHETAPRLVKLKYRVEYDEFLGSDRHVFETAPWLARDRMAGEKITSYGMKGRGAPLGRTLLMCFNDNYIADKSPLNKCVQAVTGGQAEKWGDNILVLRARDPVTKYAQFYNATMDDVEPMVAFFKDYNWRNL